MFKDTKTFSSFAVNDIAAAKDFYGNVLGIELSDEGEEMGLIGLKLASGGSVMIYPKPDFIPATYTVLNFPVDDIDKAVDELTAKGVSFIEYDFPDMGIKTDEKGISRSDDPSKGPSVAWFNDPAGNILAVMH